MGALKARPHYGHLLCVGAAERTHTKHFLIVLIARCTRSVAQSNVVAFADQLFYSKKQSPLNGPCGCGPDLKSHHLICLYSIDEVSRRVLCTLISSEDLHLIASRALGQKETDQVVYPIHVVNTIYDAVYEHVELYYIKVPTRLISTNQSFNICYN